MWEWKWWNNTSLANEDTPHTKNQSTVRNHDLDDTTSPSLPVDRVTPVFGRILCTMLGWVRRRRRAATEPRHPLLGNLVVAAIQRSPQYTRQASISERSRHAKRAVSMPCIMLYIFHLIFHVSTLCSAASKTPELFQVYLSGGAYTLVRTIILVFQIFLFMACMIRAGELMFGKIECNRGKYTSTRAATS